MLDARLGGIMIEFTDDEKSALVNLLVGVIEHDPVPLSQRIQRLRSILAKLRSIPELPLEEPDEIDDGPAGLKSAPWGRYFFSGCHRPSIAPVGSMMIEKEPAFGTSVTSRKTVAPSDFALVVA